MATVGVTMGTITLPPAQAGVTASLNASKNSAIVTFTDGTDMATAQEYLRKITITPFTSAQAQTTEHKLDVRVFGSTNT